MEPDVELDEIARVVIEEAYAIRDALGAGLYESVYKRILAARLAARGYDVEMEAPVPLSYAGIRFGIAGRMDITIGSAFLVETKAVQDLHPLHVAQTLTYLRLTQRRLALLINFNAIPLRRGIRRFVNTEAADLQPAGVRGVDGVLAEARGRDATGR